MTTMKALRGDSDESRGHASLYPLVVARVHRGLRRPDLVGDAVQHAYQKAAEKRVDLPRSKMAAWLTKTARNKLVDCLRRENRCRPLPPEFEIYADRNRAEVERTRDLVEAVRTAFGRIDEEERHVLEASYINGLSDREIGEADGVSESTARRKRCRARERLKAFLPDWVEDEIGIAASEETPRPATSTLRSATK